jgi:fumarylacetoacetase
VPRGIDATHDPDLKSWVESANQPDADFPIQNLPFAVFRRAGRGESFRGAVAIGDQVLDLGALHSAGAFPGGAAAEALSAAAAPQLNALMSLGRPAWSALRLALAQALRNGSPGRQALETALVPQTEVEFTVPARIGDFTDFYSSIDHATAVGRLLRPDNPLLPNYKWVPIAYHGRASSIRVSGARIRRPAGQIVPRPGEPPVLAACRRLDFELELGVFVGPGNALGQPIPVADAEEHVFGLCLLNDWSARDLQAWEYQPLGPFLSKNFATTISPWIVTLDALAPFRVPWQRPTADPQPLPYLEDGELRRAGALDIQLEVELQSQAMRERGVPAQRLSRSNFRHAYWAVSQMLAHHSVNGCNLEPGDLLGTGTQSGPDPAEAGSLLELTHGGTQPLTLPGGEARTFLADGDQVTLRAWCATAGRVRIGFGSATGTIVAE